MDSQTGSKVENTLKIREFVKRWTNRGYEKGESQVFWLELLHQVLGVENPGLIISFENQVKLNNTSFIDAYIEPTKVLIEQKSIDKDLRKAIKQSSGEFLTAFGQAKRYAAELPYSKRPRWVVACNFQSFLIYDMEKPDGDPVELLLKDLEKESHRLGFLIDSGKIPRQKEKEVSFKAGELVGRLYDAFLAQYGDNVSHEDLHSLNVLCVRLVFCLYAEDAGIFSKDQFYHYLIQYKPEQMRSALKALFTTLDTKVEDRDRFLEDSLAAFPYVNGSLFHQRPNEDIPRFNQEIADILLPKASLGFDWSEISPTIFGALFESTLNPVTRHAGGMHYTSRENIHKVIDPLFLNALKDEFNKIKEEKYDANKRKKLVAFQDKLASLTFLDPACGSGNFLTETYLSLRALENDVISTLNENQRFFSSEEFSPIKVSIHQFYGIEINDFAVSVAMTALWIAESQMMHKTAEIIKFDLDYLPLKPFTNIHCDNALRMDWGSLKEGYFDYIMGNPPFLGYSVQSEDQKRDIQSVYVDEKGKAYKTAGKIDYVSAWYFKASQIMQGTNTQAAFVSTNSITQGEQVSSVWKPLYDRFGIHINFAYRTFRWDSEATIKAHVHCVIVGFSTDKQESKYKTIYYNELATNVDKINPYLVNAENAWIGNRKFPICNIPLMTTGNRPADGGHLIIEANDYDGFIKAEPNAKKYIKKLTGADEYINNKMRYCLWLVNVDPTELKKMPEVMKRIELCRQARLKGAPDRQKLAKTPTLFREIKNPKNFIIVPNTSSFRRNYIPIGFLDETVIPTNAATIIPNATQYHFGILTSSVHMAWTNAVCGRLKSDYRYSKDIVYNNFPWPTPTDAQKAKIEKTAQAILDARALYPDCSLADLYGENMYLYSELCKAHEANDRAVKEAYGFNKDITESDIVAELLNIYKSLVGCESTESKPAKKSRSKKAKQESEEG